MISLFTRPTSPIPPLSRGGYREKGITVVEMVIIAALSLILMTALVRFLGTSYPLSRVTILQSRANETARLRLKRIARELREIRISDTGAYPIAEMTAQRIIFYANVDDDLATERVRYELVGTNLERGITEPSGNPLVYDAGNEDTAVVASSIQNGDVPVFVYYTGNYPDDTVPLDPMDVTEAKYIEFKLIVDADVNQDPDPVEVISQVQLRNMKTNLGDTESE